ncbi:hypothetical protein DXG01_004968 [Tephrocybe rancida]|nr:hypothetical protein DXG01_004968 [Tephrocybe rancida]
MHSVTLGLFAACNKPIQLAAAVTAVAKTVVVTVGGNTTNDATTVFQPNVVFADQGDTVVFNCKFLLHLFNLLLDPLSPAVTNGNHTATQSTFAFPCISVHDINSTINGFDSNFRDAGKQQAITTLSVTIDNSNKTIWFYDYNTCGQGGVGGINLNKTSTETIDGFQRNARRLNGTAATSSTTTTGKSGTATGSSPSTTTKNDATRLTAQGAAVLLLALAVMAASL